MKTEEIKELITQAHMAGQKNSKQPNAFDPSYSEALAYFLSLPIQEAFSECSHPIGFRDSKEGTPFCILCGKEAAHKIMKEAKTTEESPTKYMCNSNYAYCKSHGKCTLKDCKGIEVLNFAKTKEAHRKFNESLETEYKHPKWHTDFHRPPKSKDDESFSITVWAYDKAGKVHDVAWFDFEQDKWQFGSMDFPEKFLWIMPDFPEDSVSLSSKEQTEVSDERILQYAYDVTLIEPKEAHEIDEWAELNKICNACKWMRSVLSPKQKGGKV